MNTGKMTTAMRDRQPRKVEGEEMNTDTKTAGMNTRTLLVLLWVFHSVNFMYADQLSSLEPGVLAQELSGYVADGTVKITSGFLLGVATLWEIPFLMIVLSWVLKYRANRWANVIAGALFIVVQIGSLFLGIPSPAYIFYSAVEIAGLSLIVWNAWKWRRLEK
jgi:chromate transport protein ChrA